DQQRSYWPSEVDDDQIRRSSRSYSALSSDPPVVSYSGP
ncbi:hypothetical protein AVEN_250791-1, partial [Araneus ventricosus]